MSLEKVLYRANATATAGREGRGISDDRVLNVTLATPKELGGNGLIGTNPEQLFAVGYAACFLGAMRFVGQVQQIAVPDNASVNGLVGIGPIPTGLGIEVELKITLPDMDRAQAEQLVAAAHVVCPYSNATQGNIDVRLTRL